MEDLISIIIPFLNEKDEVENTLISIREYSKKVPIILINDASDDNYDYGSLKDKYDILYIVNKQRKGVAESRDLGISMCSTEYFLLLDAHMRFYEKDWEIKICSVLNKNREAIVCCQNKPLLKRGDQLIQTEKKGFGARITLYNDENELFLSLRWLYKEKQLKENLEEIPNILGAAYASSKTYWEKLKGLRGLQQYGSDEIYISIKTWLSGGKCLLIKDLEIGHIYRQSFPYNVQSAYTLYNSILILKLLFPQKYFIHLSSRMKEKACSIYRHAYYRYLENSPHLKSLKEHYKTVLIHNFSIIEYLNDLPEILFGNNRNPLSLEQIYLTLKIKIQEEEGVGLNGRMGIIVFLFLYTKAYSINSFNTDLKNLLENTLTKLNPNSQYHFVDGFLGVGWALEYLLQNHFLEADRDEILTGIDKLILESDILNISDFTLNKGILGILHYLCARISQREIEHPLFSEKYIKILYDRYAEYKDLFDSNIELFNKLYCYSAGNRLVDKISICDLLNFEKIEIDEKSNSLFNGLPFAGILQLINTSKIHV